jgi:hypothetical protein
MVGLWKVEEEAGIHLVNNGSRWRIPDPFTFAAMDFKEENIERVTRAAMEAVPAMSGLDYHGNHAHNFWQYQEGDALPHPEWDTHDPAAFCSRHVKVGREAGGQDCFRCLGHPGIGAGDTLFKLKPDFGCDGFGLQGRDSPEGEVDIGSRRMATLGA